MSISPATPAGESNAQRRLLSVTPVNINMRSSSSLSARKKVCKRR